MDLWSRRTGPRDLISEVAAMNSNYKDIMLRLAKNAIDKSHREDTFHYIRGLIDFCDAIDKEENKSIKCEVSTPARWLFQGIYNGREEWACAKCGFTYNIPEGEEEKLLNKCPQCGSPVPAISERRSPHV